MAFGRRASVLVTALALAGCAREIVANRAVDATWPADESAIRAALQSSADAWNRGDLKGHLAYYEPDVTFMTGNGPRPGVDAIEQAFSDKYFADGAPRQQLRFEQVAVRALGADFALATGRYVLEGGGEAEQSGWYTTIWRRTPEGWRTIHDHSS
ncbi:MAG TPA: SgcJ/EcaC family oxidoreductase [Steroidobacteraceae bacterium]|jgi:beta-aspartyl-peptidase (threonine type)